MQNTAVLYILRQFWMHRLVHEITAQVHKMHALTMNLNMVHQQGFNTQQILPNAVPYK